MKREAAGKKAGLERRDFLGGALAAASAAMLPSERAFAED